MHTHAHTHAVRGLTMGIKRGECFGMLGPNGAGKTTAINMLIGYSSSLIDSRIHAPYWQLAAAGEFTFTYTRHTHTHFLTHTPTQARHTH